jgi:hypothetical protein
MKKLLLVLISGLLAVVFMGTPAAAQQEEGQYASDESWGSYQYVQGTITDVSPAYDQIRVEGGDGLIDFAVPPGSVASPEDLAVGEEVTVGFYDPPVNLLIYPPQRTADQITIL